MKFFAVLFLFGFAVASAVPLFSKVHDAELLRYFEEESFDFSLESEGEHDLEYVKKQLRERFEEVLKKIKDAVEHGKGLREDLLEKIHILKEKLKHFKIDFSEKSKNILKEIREKSKDYLRKLLERLGLERNEVDHHAEEILLNADNDFDVGKLKEQFDDLVKKVKDAFEQGKTLKDALDKLQKVKELLKNLNIDLGEKGKEYLQILKEKVKDYWNKLKEKLTSKRHSEADFYEMMEQLKEMLLQGVDEAGLKELVHKVFGNGESNEFTEHFFTLLRYPDGRDRLLEWVTRILDGKNSKRSISDVYQKIKEYFKDLNIELKEKFVRFGEWVKEQYQKGLEKGKSKAENIKRIAEEFLKDTRNIGKDMAQEALDFFQEYKKDLGKIYDDLVDKVSEILKS